MFVNRASTRQPERLTKRVSAAGRVGDYSSIIAGLKRGGLRFIQYKKVLPRGYPLSGVADTPKKRQLVTGKLG